MARSDIRRGVPFYVAKHIICKDNPASIDHETLLRKIECVKELDQILQEHDGGPVTCLEPWTVKFSCKQNVCDMISNKVVPGVCLTIGGKFVIDDL